MDCSIGEKILIFRRRQKMSRKELAQITEISATTIANYEQSKTRPSAENMNKIAMALNVSLNDFVSFRTPTKEEISMLEKRRQKHESLETVNRFLSGDKEYLIKLLEKN